MYNIPFIYRFACYIATVIFALSFFSMKIFTVTSATPPSEKKLPAILKNITSNPIIKAPSPFISLGTDKTVPGVPEVPKMPSDSKLEDLEGIQILGTLPPDVVIISQGGNTRTVKTGDMVSGKMVGPVSLDGVYLNEIFVNLKGKNHEK